MNQVSNKDLKVFSFIWAFIFLVIAIFPLFKSGALLSWALIVSSIFIIIGVFKPRVLSLFYKYWMIFGEFIGNIMSKIIMFMLFYFMFTPIAFVLKIFKVDLLNKKLDKNTKSYWIDRETQPGSLKNQY